MLKSRALSPAPSHEDLFIQRYRRLLTWALKLTDDHEQAEDLVHDTFIQFTLNRPDLESIENLDGYLRTTLKNVHLSQVRRASHSRNVNVSIADYDSAEIGLRATDPVDRIRVQEELRLICHYACVRKETAKAGSVLILRFFHGYYPAEIAQVLRNTTDAVKVWLRTARGESKLYLDDPRSLRFMGEGPSVNVSRSGIAGTTEQFLRQLRQAIFHSRRGSCLPVKQLRALYETDDGGSIETSNLSHVVSCPICLDEVNTLLGLPPLSERYPTDMTDKDSGPKGGDRAGGPGGGFPINSLRRYRKRLRDTIEHQPKELRVSVNGYTLGALKINSDLIEQTLSVNVDEKIGFVEILSEQGIRLMLLNVGPPPDGEAEQKSRVEFKEGRALDVTLRFSSPWPTLHLVYRDPTIITAESEVAGESLAASLESQTEVQSPKSNAQSPLAKAEALWTNARHRWSDLGHWPLDFGLFLRPGIVTALERVGRWARLRGRLSALRLPVRDLGLLSRPASVTALLALVLIGVMLFMGRQRTTAPFRSAADLLAQSVVVEETIAARRDQVLHRTVTLEERRASGELIARSKIDVWHSAERGLTARRIYDEQNRLVAGDWRRADGVETLYAHGRKPQIQQLPHQRHSLALNFGNAWQQDLTAQDFAALVKNLEAFKLDESANTYVLSYRTGAIEGLLQATLVLSRSDLHVTEQTFIVREGNEERTYHYLETSYERRPITAVAPAVFEPEPQLFTPVELETSSSKLETTTGPADLRSLAPAAATVEVEVEVLRLLNLAGADLGEQINVTRMADGRLQVEGIVDSEKRKDELLRALIPVRDTPTVRIDLKTVAEAIKQNAKTRPSGQIVIEQLETAMSHIPADAELRRYFAGRGLTAGQLETEISRFANRVLVQSRNALFRASALKRLADRFSLEELRTLDTEARAKWLSMIREHARAYQDESLTLRRELAPVFNDAASGSDRGEPITDDASLVQAASRLVELARANEQAIQAAFTLSSASSSSLVIRTAGFWRSFDSAESLAIRISRQ